MVWIIKYLQFRLPIFVAKISLMTAKVVMEVQRLRGDYDFEKKCFYEIRNVIKCFVLKFSLLVSGS